MRLDKKAQLSVHEEIEEMIDEANHEDVENTKFFIDDMIRLYLNKLEATDTRMALSNLANTRNGMLAIINACNSAIAELKRASNVETRALCDTFTKYLRMIIVQADTHFAGSIN